jgi:seryl-tRNA synthetase
MYYVGIDDLYLIPTAEVPLTNLYRDVILKEEESVKNVTNNTESLIELVKLMNDFNGRKK